MINNAGEPSFKLSCDYSKDDIDKCFKELLNLGDEFDISTSISNLIRLGLIHHEDNSINGYNYEKFKSFNIIIRNKQKLDNLNNSEGNGITTSVEIQKQVIMKNNFGERFADTCL